MGEDGRSVWSREYLTMPGVRELDWPVSKVYSLPLKVAGEGHLLEKMWDEKRANKSQHVKKKMVVENLRVLENNAAFVNTTTLKSQMARLGRHVELGLKKAEEDLEVKRNKLRQVILQEDTALTHEYVEKAQKLADELYEEKKKLAEDIVKRHIKEREDEARTKLEQLRRENSEELREKISIVKKMEAAEIQKYQICEKKMQLEREKEFDNFWLELQMKRDKECLRYEEEEEQIRMSRIKEQREVLNKQVLGKLMMEEEMKKIVEKEAAYVEKLRERLMEEEREEKEFKLKQKLEQMKIQKAQLEEYRRLKVEKQREEKEFDNYYVNMLNDAIRKDNMKVSDTRAEVRREAEFFKRQLAEIRAAQEVEERQIEELRAQEVKKKDEIVRSHQLALKEARDKLQRETLEAWKQQVILKKNTLDSDRKNEVLAYEWSEKMLGKNKALDELLVKQRKESQTSWGNDLHNQEKYEQLLKERQALEDKEFRNKQEEDEKERNELIQTFGTCFGPPHPFTKAIRDNQ